MATRSTKGVKILQVPQVNTWVGKVAGAIVYVPYDKWRWQHVHHHVVSRKIVRTKTPDVADASHATLVPHVALVAKLA